MKKINMKFVSTFLSVLLFGVFVLNCFDSRTADAATTIVVAKDGSGSYTTVQAAINSISSSNSSWVTISVKNGTYTEVVHVNKPYIKLVGQSATGTIITYNNYNSLIGSTSGTATIFFEKNNFIAENITFQNSFAYDSSTVTGKQAVAAEPMADRQTFYNCRFIGHQDTLYVRTGRQYFKNCYIQGCTDFIFGDATAVFDQCEIYSHSKGSASCMTAPNTAATTTYGLVFLTCKLTGDSSISAKSISLGRPWSVNAACAYLYCTLGAHCTGWTNMDSRDWHNARFKEYKNTGSGAVVSSDRPQLTDAEAKNYTVQNILKGSDNWNPTTQQ